MCKDEWKDKPHGNILFGLVLFGSVSSYVERTKAWTE